MNGVFSVQRLLNNPWEFSIDLDRTGSDRLEKWRWIPYQVGSAAENMAIDEAIMIQHRLGHVPPTIRFYGWTPAACSIGYFQKIERELDLVAIKEQGLSFVRRLTGGRTVFHDQELTYSLVVSEEHPLYSTSVTQSYLQISKGLLAGFAELALDATVAPARRTRKKAESSACFDTASDYEIQLFGKKVVGSAQVRQQGVLLQHGSILLDVDADRFFQLLRFPSEAARNRMKRIFTRQAGAINQFTKEKKSLEDVIKAFYRGFMKGMNITLEKGELTSAEKELAQQLAKEKYTSDDWNFMR